MHTNSKQPSADADETKAPAFAASQLIEYGDIVELTRTGPNFNNAGDNSAYSS